MCRVAGTQPSIAEFCSGRQPAVYSSALSISRISVSLAIAPRRRTSCTVSGRGKLWGRVAWLGLKLTGTSPLENNLDHHDSAFCCGVRLLLLEKNDFARPQSSITRSLCPSLAAFLVCRPVHGDGRIIGNALYKVFRYSMRSQRSCSLSSGPITPGLRSFLNSCPALEFPGCGAPG